MATEMLFVAQFDVALPGMSMKKRSRSARAALGRIMIDMIEFEHDDEPAEA